MLQWVAYGVFDFSVATTLVVMSTKEKDPVPEK
jgi:hypothetical protein